MGEGFGESDIIIHFLQQISAPNCRQAAIEIEYYGIKLLRHRACADYT